MDGSCAKGALIPEVNYALVRAALQTVPEELADGGFLFGSAVLGVFCSQCGGRMEELGIVWKYPEKGMFWVPQQKPEEATENITYFWW